MLFDWYGCCDFCCICGVFVMGGDFVVGVVVSYDVYDCCVVVCGCVGYYVVIIGCNC